MNGQNNSSGGVFMQKKRKKILAAAMVAILCLLAPAAALELYAVDEDKATVLLPVDVEAQSAIVMDAMTGQILYEKDIHARLYPASTTKLMTLLLTVEAVESGRAGWEDPVVASKLAESYGGSQIYLSEGEILSLRELALGIAMASGNDAAVAIAEYLGGTHEGFVAMMNQRAAELGMKNTNFVNANGLHDENHYTTAFDLCLLGREAASHPALLELTSTKHYRIREDTKPFQYDNTNKLLWQYPGTKGLKTGWTEEAGYCLVAAVERNDLQLISVVLNSPKPKGHFEDSKKLLNWAYNTYIRYKPAPQELPQIVLPVQHGKRNSLDGVLPSRWGIALKKGESPEISYAWDGPAELEAPVEEGQVLGYLRILGKEGRSLLKLTVTAAEKVEKESLPGMFTRIVLGMIG